MDTRGRRLLLAGIVLAVLIAGFGTVQATSTEPPAPSIESAHNRLVESPADVTTGRQLDEDGEIEEGGGEEGGEGEGEEGVEDEETGPRVLPEWWGLGGEAREAPYLGLAELGVVLLAIGVIGYRYGKRTSIVPNQYRRRLLQGHEWTMLVGTALTVPHVLFVEEWEGLGALLVILLGVEVLSGLYGRHLHRRVIRLGRGDETAPLLGRFLELSVEVVFARWRKIHITLTIVTAVVLPLHIVTAVGG